MNDVLFEFTQNHYLDSNNLKRMKDHLMHIIAHVHGDEQHRNNETDGENPTGPLAHRIASHR